MAPMKDNNRNDSSNHSDGPRVVLRGVTPGLPLLNTRFNWGCSGSQSRHHHAIGLGVLL